MENKEQRDNFRNCLESNFYQYHTSLVFVSLNKIKKQDVADVAHRSWVLVTFLFFFWTLNSSRILPLCFFFKNASVFEKKMMLFLTKILLKVFSLYETNMLKTAFFKTFLQWENKRSGQIFMQNKILELFNHIYCDFEGHCLTNYS